MRPSITRRDLEARIDALIEELAAQARQPRRHSGRQAVEEAAEPLETRGIVVLERGRFRVRERSVLRYYARTIEHCSPRPAARTDGRDARQRFERPSSTSSPKARILQDSWPRATACGSRRASPAASSPARRSRKRSRPRARSKRAACCMTLDYLGESVTTPRRGRRGDARLPRGRRRDRRRRHRAQPLAEAHAARARRRSRDAPSTTCAGSSSAPSSGSSSASTWRARATPR